MKYLMRKFLSFVLIANICVFVSSVTVFASSNRILGDIKIFGNSAAPSVKINGEIVRSGQLVFPNSVIATDADSYAIISVSQLGKLELAPNTLFTISFSERALSGELSAGKVTVLEGSGVEIRTPSGETVALSSGESATTQQTNTQDDDDNESLLFLLILGGVAAAIVTAAAFAGGGDIQLGTGSTVVSPTR